MEKTKERKSNFELLKIILAIFVIIVHYCTYSKGGAEISIEKGTFNYCLMNFMQSAAIIAVNTFILITGYFMCDKKEIKLSKPIKFIYLLVIYGILIYLFMFIFNGTSITKFSLHKLLQIITGKWFIIIYIILYLLIPYINKVIQSINKKQFIILLSILIGFFVIWPSVWTDITVKDGGFGIINFLVLYLIGAFIKIYYDNRNSFWLSLFIYLLCTILTSIYRLSSSKAYCYNSILIIIGSIAIFEMFKAIKIKNNPLINKISTFVLTSYIIHESDFTCLVFYKVIFNEPEYYNSPYLFLNLIYTTIGIFVICMIIESIRRLIMKKLDDKIDNIKYKIKV